MKIYAQGLDSGYELEQLCRLFYPHKSIISVCEIPDADDEFAVLTSDDTAVKTKLFIDGERAEGAYFVSEEDKKLKYELLLARVLYGELVKLTGFTPPWGVLTGVRPIKLLRSMSEKSDAERAVNRLKEEYLVSDAKLDLAKRTYSVETPLLELSQDNSFSLYISIPFCPTRCDYCSFVSQTVEKAAKLLPEYVDLLIKEIHFTAGLARELGLRLETVYMGGGTPTTLSAEQMARVLGAVNDSFDMSTVREFTVEAGRPDTITGDKLQVIKSCGAGRISINPQTMDDSILERIGRKHTTAQTIAAFELAREKGFTDINMDLIAGLPGDTIEGFARSLDHVLSLDPEAVTVHTLALKRASNLVIDGQAQYSAKGEHCTGMLQCADSRLTESGFRPYYLYRQTRIVGNLENVGWSKPGYEGLYNIYIMDETHTILAVGAGGVTKLRRPHTNEIERIFNYKFPYEYNSRFESLLERKKGVKEFYEKFC